MKRTVTKKAVVAPTKRARKGLVASAAFGGGDAGVLAHRAAAYERMRGALADVIEVSDDAAIMQALGEKTSIDALIRLVAFPGVAVAAANRTADPLRAARARGTRRQLDLMKAEGGSIGVEAAAERLGIGRAAVDKRRKVGTLLAVEGGARAMAYPVWQFREYGVLPGLERVLGAFRIADGLMRVEFFLSEDPDLGQTPLAALRAGRVDEVAASASRFGRFGDDG